nr:hypothetical protein [Tanacetum cinerariifolium]
MRPVRQNIYAAQPKRTSFYKPAHSYNKRPFQETTQDLVAILILRVQRLEIELKVRTPVHKVDRGRSRPVMAWVPKKVYFLKGNSEEKLEDAVRRKRSRGVDAASSLGEDCWELNVQSIPTASEEFSHC